MSCRKDINLTAKEKRLVRKARQKLVSVAWETVKKANDVKNPLSKFEAFSKFRCKNETSMAITSCFVDDIDEETFEQIFTLERDNMKSWYEQCEWGWHEKKKREEMSDDRARYLIAKNDENNVVAFSHYRFDLDFDMPVLYCYELQLNSDVRRQGLGKFMLQILELIAFSNEMHKVILTVLKQNTNALRFFESMNYEVDETSPQDDVFDECGYIIMSKRNKKLLSRSEVEIN